MDAGPEGMDVKGDQARPDLPVGQQWWTKWRMQYTVAYAERSGVHRNTEEGSRMEKGNGALAF